MIHSPAIILEHVYDLPVSMASMLTGKANDLLGQRHLSSTRNIRWFVQKKVGVDEYKRTPGSFGVQIWQKNDGEVAHIEKQPTVAHCRSLVFPREEVVSALSCNYALRS